MPAWKNYCMAILFSGWLNRRWGAKGSAGTLLSGAYIELQPGTKGNQPGQYQLLDSPPLAPPDAKGIRVILDSKKAGQLTAGDPVLFRGYRVGSVEKHV